MSNANVWELFLFERSIFDSMDIAWDLLRKFPKEALTKITDDIKNKYYDIKAKKLNE